MFSFFYCLILIFSRRCCLKKFFFLLLLLIFFFCQNSAVLPVFSFAQFCCNHLTRQRLQQPKPKGNDDNNNEDDERRRTSWFFNSFYCTIHYCQRDSEKLQTTFLTSFSSWLLHFVTSYNSIWLQPSALL